MNIQRYCLYLLFATSIYFLFTENIVAQGCCSGGTPLSGNLDITTGAPRSFSFRLTYDHNNLGDLVIESKELEDKTRTRITNATLFRIDYSFNNWLAASVLFSHVHQEEIIRFNNMENSTVGKGIGDLVFLLQYNALNKNDTKLAFAGGFKAPTGAIDRTNKNTGLLLNPDLQPGTGAWDFLTTAQFTQNNLLINFLNFRTSLNYRITNEANRFNQQQLYKFGNELQAYLGFNYNLFLGQIQLTPQMMFRYRHTAFDQTNGGQTPNTGGHWVYLVPGVEAYFNQKFGLGILSELPVYRNLDGIQLTTSHKVTVSLFYNLALSEKKAYKKVFD